MFNINVLLEWCATRDILLDAKISISTDNNGGIGVYARDHLILPNETLVRIPKTAVLSVRSCSLAGFIPVNPYGLGAQLSLTCALYVEMHVGILNAVQLINFSSSSDSLKGEMSHWFGYLTTLPKNIVDLPLFWGVDSDTCENGSGAQALSWLTGTEAGKILQHRTDNFVTTLEEINRFYWNVAEPLLLGHSAIWSLNGATTELTLNGFHRAFSLVSSRAFLVDAYHGLSMVPIADAFNHVVDNNVHLEADYDVCPECGSWKECPHDKDGELNLQIKDKSGQPIENHDQYYEMVSNTGVPPFAEVFNTYGEELTNAQLLTQYGFILEENQNDHLYWTLDELIAIFSSNVLQSTPQEILDFMSEFETQRNQIPFSESDIVYVEDSEQQIFCLNDEGNISHRFWIALVALCLHRFHRLGKNADAYQIAQNIFSIQIQLESLDSSGEEGINISSEILAGFEGSDTAPFELLREISGMCITLCMTRRRDSGRPGFGNSDLFEVLEEIPEHNKRTRLAVSILIGERSLLDACEARWTELSRVAGSILQSLS